MTTSLVDNVKRAIAPKRSKPATDAPTIISERELEALEPGYWYHKRYGRLRERPVPLPDDVVWTMSRVMLPTTVDGERLYRVFDQVADGVIPAPAPPQPKAQRLIDALAGSPALDRQMEIVVAPPASSVGLAIKSEMPAIRPTRRIRGAQAIIDQLAKKQITVRLATDGASLVTSGAGGNGRGVADLIEKARPLLIAYLRDGVAPRCTATAHETPGEAITVIVGGSLACEDCMTGGAS